MKSWIIGDRIYEWSNGNQNNEEVAVFIIPDVLKDYYKRPADVIEITGEEYDRLVEEIKASHSEMEPK